MKSHVRYLFTLLALLLLGTGGVKAEEVVYSLSFSKIQSSSTPYNSYATAHEFTSNERKWMVCGNQTLGDYLCVGGKNSTSIDRTSYSTSALSVSPIVKIVINHDGIKNGNSSTLQINYITIEGSANSDFSNPISKTLTKPSVNNAGYLEFTASWSAQSYFRIIVNCQLSKGSNNSYLKITSIDFYGDGGSTLFPADLAYESTSYTATLGESFTAPTLTNPNSLTVTYASSDENVATVTSDGAVNLVGAGTTTITASSEETETYAAGSASYALTVVDPNAGDGSEEKPYSVAEAIKFINTLGTSTSTNDVYVKGIISKIDSYNSTYKSITYWISDDGTTTTQMEVYSGKGLEGADFSSKEDLQKGDKVTVCGKVKLYGSIYEFDKNSIITSYEPKVLKEHELAFSAETATAERGQAFTTPTLSNPNNLDVTYKSSKESVATVAEDGTVTLLKAGTTTITASFAGDDDYKAGEVSYTLTVTVPSHNITFFVNGVQQGEPVSIAEDETITFPEATQEIEDKIFVGWTTAEIEGEQAAAPATLVTAATMGTADVTYYAVFANASEEEGVVSLVIDGNVSGLPNNQYGESNKFSELVVNGITLQFMQLLLRSDGDLQWRAAGNSNGTGTMYNENALNNIQSIVLNYSKDDTYKNFTVKVGTQVNPSSGTQITPTFDGLAYTFDCSSEDYDYFVVTNGQYAGYLTSLVINYIGMTTVYSDYCTTVVPPVKPAKPIVFHDSGKYEGELSVPMYAEEGATIKYTLNGGAEQTYSAPLDIEATTTLTAWAVKDGKASDVVTREYTIDPVLTPDIEDLDGYYTIQNKSIENKYVNVAGRKTVTFVEDNSDKAGTVIRVKTTYGKVEVLRSQAVDLPGYAKRAMNYVPELVKAVVDRLGNNDVIGEQGAILIADEFKAKFDYNLYLEEAGDGYRIYGKTPSMKPVVDFYAENKTIIDERLPKVEGFVEEILLKVAKQLGHENSPWASKFKIHDIWKQMVKTNPDLTEPVEDNEAAISQFYTEILSSEANVWNFAHETMMIYWEKVMQYIGDNFNGLGDYGKYLEKVPNILPNFKYYIVSNKEGNGIDFISEGNEDIIKDAERTVWTLEGRENFNVTLPVEKVVNIYPTSSGGTTTTYNEYYGTLYTDFAYQLPADVVAYKIDGIDVVKGKAYIKKTKLENILPAQTPVMLVSNTADIELTLVAGDVAAVSEGELRGNDYLINEYEINSSQAEGIMMILQKLSESLYNEYEHLQRRNAGTVNNKYFFGLAVDPDLGDAYKAKTGNDMEKTPVRVLTKKEDGTIAFTESWNTLAGNESFIFNEEYSDILLSRVGDVNRDGQVTIADVTALVNIVLGKVTYPANADKYDFEAANVNGDEQISIADVTALVNIILGK